MIRMTKNGKTYEVTETDQERIRALALANGGDVVKACAQLVQEKYGLPDPRADHGRADVTAADRLKGLAKGLAADPARGVIITLIERYGDARAAEEREACARLVEDAEVVYHHGDEIDRECPNVSVADEQATLSGIAAAIRARGE